MGLSPEEKLSRSAYIVTALESGRTGTDVGRELGMSRGHVYNVYHQATGHRIGNRKLENPVPAQTPADAVKHWAESVFGDHSTEEGRYGHLLMSVPFVGFSAFKLAEFTGCSLPAAILFLRKAEDAQVISRREGWIKAEWMDHLHDGDGSDALLEVGLILDTLVILGRLMRFETGPGYFKRDVLV